MTTNKLGGGESKLRGVLRGVDAPALAGLRRLNRVYWLIVIYAGVWIALRSHGVFGPPLPPLSQAAVIAVFLLAVANLALRTRFAVRRGGYGRGHPGRADWIFTAFDLTIIATGLRLTGGIDSGLWPVLILLVVAETILEPSREAWLVRLGASVALLAAVVPVPLTGGPWILETVTRLVFLAAVSSVTRRLRENSEREKSEIAALRAELSLTDERSRLSRDVHDGVGNSLAAAVLRLEVAARLLEKNADTDLAPPALLRDEAQALRQSMNAVRDWTFHTRPWPLAAPDGLLPSAQFTNEVERLARRTGLALTVQGADEIDRLPAETTTRLTVLRIAQEALTNVAKHATGATGATVTLARDGIWLVVTIQDDGGGFDAAGGAPGIGLGSMRERAEGAGGTLLVDATSGAGVTVTARLPLAPTR